MRSPRSPRFLPPVLHGLPVTPTVNDTATLRPAMSVRMSPGAAALAFADAGMTAVMAWLLVRLLSASRIRDADSRDDPRTV